MSVILFRGASPRRTPLHAPSRGPRAPLRARGSFADAHSRSYAATFSGGLRPAGPPYTRPRGGPVPRSVRVARSLTLTRAHTLLPFPGGSPRRTPLHAPSRGPRAPLRARGSF